MPLCVTHGKALFWEMRGDQNDRACGPLVSPETGLKRLSGIAEGRAGGN